MPGAKLYFYATSTTTPQDTYQDIALVTPHANPVVADASGVFAPIYFGSSGNYRVKLTTSADVQIWQLDDVPSGSFLSGSFTGTLTGYSSNPSGTFYWERSGQKVTVYLRNAVGGTSNSTAMTLTTLPAAIRPAHTQDIICGKISAGAVGVTNVGMATVGTNGIVTFTLLETANTGLLTYADNAFTDTLSKGLSAGWGITYSLD